MPVLPGVAGFLSVVLSSQAALPAGLDEGKDSVFPDFDPGVAALLTDIAAVLTTAAVPGRSCGGLVRASRRGLMGQAGRKALPDADG